MNINEQTNVDRLVAIQIAKEEKEEALDRLVAIQIAKEEKEEKEKEEKEEASLTLKSIKKICFFLDKLGYSRSMTQKTLGRKTIRWMKLAESELTDEERKVQSPWTRKKKEKKAIPDDWDDSVVPITEPITDIKSLLEPYGDVGKSRARIDANMHYDYEDYRKFRNVVKEKKKRKRGTAAVGFSVHNNRKVIELTFLDVVEERYKRRFERNKRTTGGFGSSVTSDQTVITLLDSLIKPRCPTVRFEVVEKEDNRKFK